MQTWSKILVKICRHGLRYPDVVSDRQTWSKICRRGSRYADVV